MLVALANACGLFRHILSDHELAAVRPARIEVVARMDLIGQAVAKAVAEVETAHRHGVGASGEEAYERLGKLSL